MYKNDWFNNVFTRIELAERASKELARRGVQRKDLFSLGRCSLAREMEKLFGSYRAELMQS